jgi:hypothetical protein
MYGFSILEIHEDDIFACQPFVSDKLFVLKVSHNEMFLVLEVIADGQPRLTKRLLYLEIAADYAKDHIQINFTLFEVLVDLHIRFRQIIYLLFNIPKMFVK